MPLNDQVVDVGFIGLNQLPSGRQGGVGRLVSLRNGQVVHFDPGSGAVPQKDKIQQRNGFRSLPSSGHSAYDGTGLGELDWDNPRLIHATPDDGVIAIDNGMPRVLDSDVSQDTNQDWAVYSQHRILTNKLQSEPWHTEQGVMQAQVSSTLNGVTCSAWVQLSGDYNVSTDSRLTCYVGFKSDSGTWTSASRVLISGLTDGDIVMPRVCNDGSRFWVFVGATVNDVDTPNRILVYVYNLNGLLLGQSYVEMQFDSLVPGYWDIQRVPGTDHIMLAQPNGNDPDIDDNVLFTDLSWSGSAVVQASASDNTIHCSGPIAWATNDLDELQYLITMGVPEGETGQLYMYQITGQAQTHEFQSGFTPAHVPDSLVGWVVEGSDPDEPDAFLACTIPSLSSPSSGPEFDPALRYTVTRSCPWSNTGQALVRQSNSVCLVSRAFKVNDDYVAITYYQSGSGDVGTSVEAASIDDDDYFIGSPEQPVTVSIGDTCYGSTKSAAPVGIINSNTATASLSIAGGDSVQSYVHPGGLLEGYEIAAGTLLVKWNIATMTALATKVAGKLVISGCDLADANGTWYVAAPRNSGVCYTFPASVTGLVPVGAMTTGTAQVQTSGAAFVFVDMPGVTGTNRSLFTGGSVTFSGLSTYNGTHTVNYVTGMNQVYPGYISIFFSYSTSDPSLFGSGSCTLDSATPNLWRFFDSGPYDAILPGSNLVISGDTQVPENNGTFPIVSGSGNAITVSSSVLTAQILVPPLPNAAITLVPGQVPYTFHLENVTFTYRYINAIISVTDSVDPRNNGLYRIVQVLDSHTVVTIPISGDAIKTSASLATDPGPSISISLSANQSPQIQPTWFVTPLSDVASAQVGKFEMGLAYSDWRREALASDLGSPNPYLLQVTDVSRTDSGWAFVLPYRAESVTTESATVIGGNVSSAGVSANTIGLKQFRILDKQGKALPGSNMLPGLLAAQLDGDQVCEYGINLGLEQPWIVSQAVASGSALEPGQTYFYSFCLEASDDAGNRIWTAPSPILEVVMTGDNNYNVISGRLPVPWNTSGLPVSDHYGVSSRVGLNLCGYRTAFAGGQMSTIKFKITSDLNPNALAPISDTNASGFAFPDEFTWTYTDQNLDGVISSAEALYTDRGLAPRFAPPAFEQGVNGWLTRDWLLAYDGSIVFSGEQTEAEQDWFFPLFRIPSRTRPTALADLEQYLAVFCLDSKHQLPAFAPPLATGQLQQPIPSLVRLPLSGGSLGSVLQVHGGVVYSSSLSGVWFLTRDLRDEWLSSDVIDLFEDLTVTDLVLDGKNRIHVLTGTSAWMVYDQLSHRWYNWIAPEPGEVSYGTTVSGNVTYLSDRCAASQDPELYHDQILDQHLQTEWGWEVASLNFGNIRGVKLCRLIQLAGERLGDHTLTVYISYPDENPTVEDSVQVITPDSDDPYIIDCYPYIEEGSSFGLKVDVTFPDNETAENSCSFDTFSAEVAVDSKPGLNKSVTQARKRT